MKKSNLFIASLCTVVMGLGFAATSFAGVAAGTGIVDSKHDMRSYTGSTSEVRVCAYCHTPHHAVEDLDADYMPLWSRAISGETFVEYSTSTIDGVQSGLDPVVGPSRLCMGCHDGAVAIDAYYGMPGTATMVEGDAFGEIGVGLDGDLTNDHPIGFDYNDVALADAEINDASTVFGGGTATIASVLYDDGLNGAIMTCASCHDVHNGPTVVDNAFLYGVQEDSAFCTTCHAK